MYFSSLKVFTLSYSSCSRLTASSLPSSSLFCVSPIVEKRPTTTHAKFVEHVITGGGGGVFVVVEREKMVVRLFFPSFSFPKLSRRRRRRRRTIPIRFRFAARLLSIPPEKTATTERRRTKRRSPFFSLLLLASDRSSRRKSNTNPAACFPSCFLPRTTTPRVLWGDWWYHLRFWK